MYFMNNLLKIYLFLIYRCFYASPRHNADSTPNNQNNFLLLSKKGFYSQLRYAATSSDNWIKRQLHTQATLPDSVATTTESVHFESS